MNSKERRFLNEYNYDLFSSYITSMGWNNDGSYNGIFTIWHRQEEEYYEYELILPENKLIKRYEETILRILENLSIFYKKEPNDIIDEFYNSINDKIKFSIRSDMTENGSIPLNEGIKIFESTKEMIVSSFLAVNKKKKNYIGPKPKDVTEVLDKIQLGQTEEGSYVINIFLPRDYYENKEVALLYEDSYTRKALNTMAEATTELLSKIEEYEKSQDIEVFDDSVNSGVSSNLCNAISDMSSDGMSDVNIEIKFNNGIQDVEEIKNIFIKRSLIPTINIVRDYYKKEMIEEEFLLVGYVTKLHQEVDEEDGDITLTGIVEEKLKKIKMNLDSEQYTIAQHAHQEKKQVVCKGRLVMKEHSTILDNITSVLLSDDVDLES